MQWEAKHKKVFNPEDGRVFRQVYFGHVGGGGLHRICSGSGWGAKRQHAGVLGKSCTPDAPFNRAPSFKMCPSPP